MASDTRIERYADFWPFYLREHARPATRAWHFVGLGVAIALVIAAILTQVWWVVLGALVAGYGFAWVSHMTVEHNRPATFTYPLWSLISDWRMFVLWLSGNLAPHLERAGVAGHKD